MIVILPLLRQSGFLVAQNNGVELSEADAHKAIVTPLRNLPPHADVKDALKALKEKGYKLVSFTNSSNQGVKTQFENAGLIDLFDVRLSVEDIKTYKPNLKSYRWACETLGVEPGEAMMVAATVGTVPESKPPVCNPFSFHAPANRCIHLDSPQTCSSKTLPSWSKN